MGVEDSCRKRYKPYARVVWEVCSLEKEMKCNRTVTVIGVAWNEKESGVFRYFEYFELFRLFRFRELAVEN